MDGAEHYDRYVAPFTVPYTEAVVHAVVRAVVSADTAGGMGGRLVLDHGAGTGAVTAALLVSSPRVAVVALDPSGPMLARLPERVRSVSSVAGVGASDGSGDAAVERLTVVEGTSAVLGAWRDGSDRLFDAVTSSLVFMFIADAGEELTRLAAAARPGATLALSVLGAPAELVPFDSFWQAVRTVMPGTAEPATYPHFRHADPSGLCATINTSGWRDAEVSRIESFRTLDCDELWAWVGRALGVRMADGSYRNEPLSDSEATAVHTEVCRLIAPYRQANGRYRLPVHGWLVTATRAG